MTPLVPLLIATALASNPAPRRDLPSGAKVTLRDIATTDPAYADRLALRDADCTVGAEGLALQPLAWFSGTLECGERGTHSFSRVAVELSEPLSADEETDCPEDARAASQIDAGSLVKVLAVAPDDRWSRIDEEVAFEGEVVGGLFNTHGSEGCWLGGTVRSEDGEARTYHAAAFEVKKKPRLLPSGRTCPAGASRARYFSEGTRVKILAVHVDDAYYGTRGSLIGQQGTVAGDLHNNGDCWFGGGMTLDRGDYLYWYKAAVTKTGSSPDAGCPAGVLTGGTIGSGRRVTVVDLHPDDAYYSSRYGIIGVSGTSGGMSATSGCWYGGAFTSDDGNDYYFYKAQLKSAGGRGSPGGGYPVGTAVRITGVSSADAFYSMRDKIVGLRCTVTEALTSTGSGWYGGELTCSGLELYFYQVSVSR